MARAILIQTMVFIFLLSCKTHQIRNLSFEGELYAKNLVSVNCDFPKLAEDVEYSWYTSPTGKEDWERLDGIWSDEIILLTSYVDKFLKCEIGYRITDQQEKLMASIISQRPIEYRGNPNTDWFHDAGFGIMLHYLKPAIVPGGGSKEWNEAVNSFDVVKFASQVKAGGAGFVLFTLGQNSGYYCSPNSVYDSIVSVKPGELCSKRDLPMDLMVELKKHNIPLLLYLPSNPPISNKMVSEKFKYSFGKDTATSQFNQPLLEAMIREWSVRYGEGVKGWWFDGLYAWNGIRSTRMDMSLKHNINTHTLAAKAGNKQSIVTYNSGFGKIKANTPYCDYSSGEKGTIDEFPCLRASGITVCLR